MTYTKLGKPNQAASAYQKAIDLAPQSVAAHYGLGVALMKQGKLDQAISALIQAVNINPSLAMAHYNLACIYSLKKETNQAMFFFQKAVTLDPDYKDHSKNDTDFNNVRHSSIYQELIK